MGSAPRPSPSSPSRDATRSWTRPSSRRPTLYLTPADTQKVVQAQEKGRRRGWWMRVWRMRMMSSSCEVEVSVANSSSAPRLFCRAHFSRQARHDPRVPSARGVPSFTTVRAHIKATLQGYCNRRSVATAFIIEVFVWTQMYCTAKDKFTRMNASTPRASARTSHLALTVRCGAPRSLVLQARSDGGVLAGFFLYISPTSTPHLPITKAGMLLTQKKIETRS